MSGTHPIPGSLPEGAGSPQGLTEGVSSDGCSMPMVYEPAIINSETFERLRSSKYTPSVSLSLDSSLREGAGVGLYHSTCRPETATLRAIFIAPTEGAIQRAARKSPECNIPLPGGGEGGWGLSDVEDAAGGYLGGGAAEDFYPAGSGVHVEVVVFQQYVGTGLELYAPGVGLGGDQDFVALQLHL